MYWRLLKISKNKLENNFIKLKKDYDAIKKKSKPNFFQITSTSRRELSYSSLLAWMLNPEENHNFKSKFLNEFISYLNKKSENKFSKNNLDKAIVKTEVSRNDSRIDVLVESDAGFICIENKTKSFADMNQLEKEAKNFKPHWIVLLAPDLHFNIKNQIKGRKIKGFKFLSYEQLRKLILSFIKLIPKHDIKLIINQFIMDIEVNIMKEGYFSDNTNLYLKNIKEIKDLEKNFYDDRNLIRKAFRDWIEKNYECKYKVSLDSRTCDYFQIFYPNWRKKDNYDVHVEISMKPEYLAMPKRIFNFRINVESKNVETRAKIRAKLKSSKVFETLKNLKYELKEDSWQFMVKKITFEKNILNIMKKEFEMLVGKKVFENIDSVLSNLK